jgi:hypothetical protein
VSDQKQPTPLRRHVAARLCRAGGLFMPKEKDGTTKGYAFIEYLDENMAMAAMQQTQGYRLDKNHVFKVNRFDDFERLAKVRGMSKLGV